MKRILSSILLLVVLCAPSWAALSDNLISYWALDEASGTRADKVVASANTLSDNNTVTGNPGKVYATSSQFTSATTEFLSHTDNASLSVGGTAYSFVVWFYLDDVTSDHELVVKNVSGSREFEIYFQASDKFVYFYTWSNSSEGGEVGIGSTSFGALSASTWYMATCTADLTNNKISINAGTQNSIAAASPGYNGTGTFSIGARSDASTPFNGRMGPVMFFKRALSSGDITTIYNNGAGLTYEGILGTGIIPHPLTSGFTSVSTSATTASVTTTANDLLLLTIVGSGTTNSALSTLSGLGLTWESVRAANWNTSGVPTRRIQVFRAMGGGATGSLTWTLTGSDGMAWSLIAFSNCQTGNNGADAIVQSASNMTNSQTSVSVTLSAFGDATNNVAFGVFGINTIGGITPGSGFVEIHDTTYTSPNAELQTQWKIGEDTGVDASFASSDNGAIGIEIKKGTAAISAALISTLEEN